MVTAELPGVPREGINIEVKDNRLCISGERKHEKKEENEKWHRVERSYGRFIRQLVLPEGVETAAIDAGFKEGVLTVSIPKSKKPEAFTVKISDGNEGKL